MMIEQLLRIDPRKDKYVIIFLVDRVALSHPEHPFLVVDLWNEPGYKFPAIPSQVEGIQNNLSVVNMDFFEFADIGDADGIFRGLFR